MSDDLLHNAFNNNPISGNRNNINPSPGAAPGAGAMNNSGGGVDKSDHPSTAAAIISTLANNTLGQIVLVTVALFVIVYAIYAAVIFPTFFGTPSKNTESVPVLLQEPEEEVKPRKPSFMQKLFCRGGRTSSFCSIDEREQTE